MVEFRSTGGIFWRLDGSGNLTAYDTAGTVLAKFTGGFFSAGLNKGTAGNHSPISSTASLTTVETGYYTLITPKIAGTVVVIADIGGVYSDTAGDAVSLSLWASASQPTGGAAVSGTRLTSANAGLHTSGTANEIGQVTIATISTGLTVGTAYYFKIGASAVTGGTAFWTPDNNTPIAIEL